MSAGKKEQILVTLLSSFFNFLNTLRQSTNNFLEQNLTWFEYFNLINQFFDNKNNNWNYNFKNKGFFFPNYSINFNKFVNFNLNVKSIFLKKVQTILPIFTFFIYNVDKNIRKFSRGKSGKYTFIWKYVAPYKRPYISLKWLIKDIKFNSNHKLFDRLTDTFLKLTKDPKASFAWRSNTFAHNYVFKNLKKTLMTTSRTVI